MIRWVLDWEYPEDNVSSSGIPSSLPFFLPKTPTSFQVNTSTLFMQNTCSVRLPQKRLQTPLLKNILVSGECVGKRNG